MTVKERNLLKGAIRRVFSRSELRRRVLALSVVDYRDEKRPRVKKWSICFECKQYTPTYKMQIDHLDPIIPVTSSLEEMSWDEVVNRTWCEENNLNPTCKICHNSKTKLENAQRRKSRKDKRTL